MDFLYYKWEYILDFHWSRAVPYYSTHEQMASSDGVIYFNKTFLWVFVLYKTNRFHFAVRLYCNRSQKTTLRGMRAKNKKSRHSTSSSVIYYSTDTRKNEIYLLNNKPTKKQLSWSKNVNWNLMITTCTCFLSSFWNKECNQCKTGRMR